MYDPTVFENLKVAFENQVYDLDTIERKIDITNRVDQMDFSVMGRYFAIQFTLAGQPEVTAEIVLEASLEELAAEILEKPDTSPGCSLVLRFHKRVQQVSEQCMKIEQALHGIWEPDQKVKQILSFEYGQEASSYLNKIEVAFNHKINEEHMGELEDFLEHVLETLVVLTDI